VAIAFPATDLLSGVVHWAADTWGSSATPLIGPKLIAPFREHHHDPQAILAHGFMAANGAACLLALPLAAGALALPVKRSAIAGAGLAFVWGLLFFAALTNQFHAWAHARTPPRLVAWLQRRRLILEPVHHAVHHTAHLKHYCVTSGWLNPWLEANRVFPRLERLVTTLTGRRPREPWAPRCRRRPAS
jgi:ubiquitin-conjugating enzyme E2 variant